MSHEPSQTNTPPLTAAALNGHAAALKLLLDWDAQVGFGAPDGTTALMAAASGGHASCVAELIKAGAAVDHTDHSGMSALMLAAAEGHADVIQCLVEHNAVIERQSFQVGFVHCMCYCYWASLCIVLTCFCQWVHTSCNNC